MAGCLLPWMSLLFPQGKGGNPSNLHKLLEQMAGHPPRPAQLWSSQECMHWQQSVGSFLMRTIILLSPVTQSSGVRSGLLMPYTWLLASIRLDGGCREVGGVCLFCLNFTEQGNVGRAAEQK